MTADPDAAAYVRPLTALEASCIICHGAGFWGGEHAYPCQCREPVDPVKVRKMLMRLTVEQMAFLRRFEHTLAYQPVTAVEWDASCVAFYVEDDDAVIDEEGDYGVLIPATRHWFASGQASMGPQHDGIKTWIKYNPTGLALREALMAGATASCR